MAPPTIGRLRASLFWHRAAAWVAWSVFSAESEPAKAVWALMKSVTPAPEPDGAYSIVAPEQACW